MSDCLNPIHCILPPVRTRQFGAIQCPEGAKAGHRSDCAIGHIARDPHRAVTVCDDDGGPFAGSEEIWLVYDMENQGSSFLPGTLARGEKDEASTGPAVNEAFNYSGNTYDFYWKLFNRNSLDDKGMTLISSVHLGANYNNAFWNGEQMAYGDGDGVIFIRFTKSLDVVGHELTHGVVSHTSNLDTAMSQAR